MYVRNLYRNREKIHVLPSFDCELARADDHE